jgi:membrane protein CcdC involved in cytochrome C biogenesis
MEFLIFFPVTFRFCVKLHVNRRTEINLGSFDSLFLFNLVLAVDWRVPAKCETKKKRNRMKRNEIKQNETKPKSWFSAIEKYCPATI